MDNPTEITDCYCGNPYTLDRTIGNLLAPLVGATLGLKDGLRDQSARVLLRISEIPSDLGQILDPGSDDPDAPGRYVAEVVFLLSDTITSTYWQPGITSFGYIETEPGPYTAEVLAFTPPHGGSAG